MPAEPRVVRFEQLIGLDLDDQDYAEAVDEFATLYFDLQRQGADPVMVEIEATPSGDRWVLEFDAA